MKVLRGEESGGKSVIGLENCIILPSPPQAMFAKHNFLISVVGLLSQEKISNKTILRFFHLFFPTLFVALSQFPESYITDGLLFTHKTVLARSTLALPGLLT